MLSCVLLWVSILFLDSDGSPGHIGTLLEKYKSSGYFQGPVIQSVRLSVIFQCYELCGYFPRCASISYNPGRHQCHLHNATGTVLPDQNWVHIKTISRTDKQSCSSSSCPEKLCVPVSARGHVCVEAMLEGNTREDSTGQSIAQGTSSTHDVGEHPETMLNAVLETSLSDTLTLDNNQNLAQSSDMRNIGSITPTMTLTYNQVDKLEDMATSSVEIKATPPAALTVTYELMDMMETKTAYETMNTGASDIRTSASDIRTSASVISTSASDISARADPQVSAISDHTSAEVSVVTVPSLVVSNTNLADGEAAVDIVSKSLTTIGDTTFSLPDESSTTLSPEMLKRKLFLKLYSRFLAACINTFVMPFEETTTCVDKLKVQRNGKPCSCKTGLHFKPSTKVCVKHCRTYGRFIIYQSRLFCISGHNDRVIPTKGNVKACARACVKEATFVCRSFEIYMGGCYLSRDTRASVKPLFWVPFCGCKYYQRTCAR